MEIGIDMTRISRFVDKDYNFIKKILTEDELFLYESEEDFKKSTFLATHWTIKEAIYKATQRIDYLRFTILKDDKGKPFIKGYPNFKVSVTHEGDYVTAFVVVE